MMRLMWIMWMVYLWLLFPLFDNGRCKDSQHLVSMKPIPIHPHLINTLSETMVAMDCFLLGLHAGGSIQGHSIILVGTRCVSCLVCLTVPAGVATKRIKAQQPSWQVTDNNLHSKVMAYERTNPRISFCQVCVKGWSLNLPFDAGYDICIYSIIVCMCIYIYIHMGFKSLESLCRVV